MNLLIIGIDGKIALNYLNYAYKKTDHKIFCLDHNIDHKYISEVQKQFTVIDNEVNITNIEDMIKKYNINKILNFYELKEGTKEELTKHNYDYIVDLYNLCIKYNVEHLVQTSTTHVYGSSNLYFSETNTLKHTSDYLSSKINAELYLLDKKEVNTSILRISEVFGPIFKDSFLDKILSCIAKRETLYIDEDSDFIRSYIDILDCVYVIDLVLTTNLYGVYNICSDLYLNAKALAQKIITLFDYEDKAIFTATKPVELVFNKPDPNKIFDNLEYDFGNQAQKFEFYLQNIKHKYRLHI